MDNKTVEAAIMFLAGLIVMGAGLIMAIPMVDESEKYYSPVRWAGMGACWVAGLLIQLKANEELKLI